MTKDDSLYLLNEFLSYVENDFGSKVDFCSFPFFACFTFTPTKKSLKLASYGHSKSSNGTLCKCNRLG
jgi:hypothetical protein